MTSNLTGSVNSAIIAHPMLDNSSLIINPGVTLLANNNNASISIFGNNNVLLNNGTITAGRGLNLHFSNNTTIINNGSIIGLSSLYDGIYAGGTGMKIYNSADAVISGYIGIETLGPANTGTIINAGTITGTDGTAIKFAGANNAIILATSSVINGDIETEMASGNTLLLQGGINSTGTLVSSLTGSGFESLMVDAAGSTWTLQGTNIITGATTVQMGTLNAANAASLGTSAVGINAAGVLDLSFNGSSFSNSISNDGILVVSGHNDTLASNINGAGTNRITGANAAIAGNNGTFTGLWDIASGGSAAVTAQSNLGPASTQINGTLNLLPINGGFAYGNVLTGTGILHAVMATATDAFSFSPSAGTDFSGTVALGLGRFDLSGVNTAALTHAMLRIDSGNLTTVGNGNQTIDGLSFNGGTALFDASVLGAPSALTTITTTGPLDISGIGTVQAFIPSSFTNSSPTVNTELPLLQQDDAPVIKKLVIAQGSLIGSGGGLALIDQNGLPISNAQTLPIEQNSQTVAIGTYDYRMSSGSDGDGLYISYGLKTLDLFGTDVNALILTPAVNATGPATDMSAKITGTGDLAIEAGLGALVSLSNPLNDYTGATFARTGTLQFMAENVLGLSSHLDVFTNSVVDMNGRSQSVGALNSEAGAQIVISGASTLSITDSQRVSGDRYGGGIEANTLFGSGTISVADSTLHVNGTQPGFAGSLNIGNATEIIANAAAAFDAAQQIAFTHADGLFTFGSNAAVNSGWTAVPNGTSLASFVGEGTVRFQDAANVYIAGNNGLFSGVFDIAPGAVMHVDTQAALGSATISANGIFDAIANSDWQLATSVTGSGSVQKSGSSVLTVDQALSGFSGLTDITAGTLIAGDATMTGSLIGGNVHIASGAYLSGTGTVMGPVNNQGNIAALNALSGHGGDPVSNLAIGSLTNSGVIQLAGTTTGNTLTVTNGLTSNGGKLLINTELASDNAQTDRLILNGGTTSGTTSVIVRNTNGTGAATVTGIRIVETTNGAETGRDAFIVDPLSSGYRAGQGTLAIGAYDYSLLRGGTDGTGGNINDWYLSSFVNSSPDSTPTPFFRPEGGAYIDNRQTAQSMFLLTFRDREGQGLSAMQDNDRAAWARVIGYKTKAKAGSDSLSVESTTVATQIGVDLFDSIMPAGRFKTGAMVGFGRADIDSRSSVNSSMTADGNVDGSSVGAYATWMEDPKGSSGPYVDTWLQYGWFSNSVTGNGLASENYHANTFSASLEAGYGFGIAQSQNWHLSFEPQLQAIYQNYSASSFTETGGTRISFPDDNSVITRAGGRLQGMYDVEGGLIVRPYVEANWWHTPAKDGVKMNGDIIDWNKPANTAEAKLGIAGEHAKKWSFWVQVTGETGDRYYGYGGQVGGSFAW
ncbi:autotransporter outer membrane beta-barrel domain-containing protein [Limnobaculum parvum]|uniref:autotransporter outer membrane beta-barrel domain-containing protein n=1 Tax=Limnobaculum parvum TaxID=2172103 RepID=UPI0013006119|nr:autotransporter outer membrane beta-barrel domain-containing protein [Limnobaculum parvum]